MDTKTSTDGRDAGMNDNCEKTLYIIAGPNGAGKTMNTKLKSTPSPEGQRQLETLRLAVDKALEKKRRLGQYSVTWKNGKPVVAGEDVPNTHENDLKNLPE
jgi:hypothetical protein